MRFKERAQRLKSDVPAVFMALSKPKTPVIAKIFGGITVAYALSPIDLIPDFIPVLGYLDDLLLLPLLVALTLHFIPKEIFEECRERSAALWQDGKPKRWYYAIPIVLFWLLIIGLVVKMVRF